MDCTDAVVFDQLLTRALTFFVNVCCLDCRETQDDMALFVNRGLEREKYGLTLMHFKGLLMIFGYENGQADTDPLAGGGALVAMAQSMGRVAMEFEGVERDSTEVEWLICQAEMRVEEGFARSGLVVSPRN